MPISDSEIKANPKYETFSIRVKNPLSGIKSTEEETTGFVRAIIGTLSKHSDGIEECIGSVLELNPEDYDVVISGTSRDTSQLGGRHVEYMFTVSIFPRLEPRRSA